MSGWLAARKNEGFKQTLKASCTPPPRCIFKFVYRFYHCVKLEDETPLRVRTFAFGIWAPSHEQSAFQRRLICSRMQWCCYDEFINTAIAKRNQVRLHARIYLQQMVCFNWLNKGVFPCSTRYYSNHSLFVCRLRDGINLKRIDQILDCLFISLFISVRGWPYTWML